MGGTFVGAGGAGFGIGGGVTDGGAIGVPVGGGVTFAPIGGAGGGGGVGRGDPPVFVPAGFLISSSQMLASSKNGLVGNCCWTDSSALRASSGLPWALSTRAWPMRASGAKALLAPNDERRW